MVVYLPQVVDYDSLWMDYCKRLHGFYVTSAYVITVVATILVAGQTVTATVGHASKLDLVCWSEVSTIALVPALVESAAVEVFLAVDTWKGKR